MPTLAIIVMAVRLGSVVVSADFAAGRMTRAPGIHTELARPRLGCHPKPEPDRDPAHRSMVRSAPRVVAIRGSSESFRGRFPRIP